MPRGGRKKGADSHKYDQWMMPGLISFCEFYTRAFETSEWSAIRAWLEMHPTTTRLFTRGSSIETTVKRLHHKMKWPSATSTR
jgi:hypothetical protein